MRHILIAIAAAALGVSLAPCALGAELTIDYQVYPGHPIQHQAYYQGERELFGYAPLFFPNTVTFDNNNVPYLRYGSLTSGKNVITRSDATTGGVVQTLDANGNWIELPFIDDIRAAYPTWNGVYTTGTHFEERIVFDEVGDAYMIVNNTRGSNINRNLLLYSTDKTQSWQVYPLPHPYGFGEWAFFEVPDSQSKMIGPPTIHVYGGGFDSGSPITLVKPTKTGAGGLSIGSGALALSSNQVRAGVVQAGLGNATATVGNTTYLSYANLTPFSGHADDTAQFIISYNHDTGQVSDPRLLGFGYSVSGSPDLHNAPAIALDSQGTIHAILGAHQGRLQYSQSWQPNSIDAGFTSPTFIGKNPPNSIRGYTYISMVIDQEDTIHVVSRYAGDNNRWALDYLRKTADGAWEDRGHLIQAAWHLGYSTFDQKLTIDHLGRLFLRYSYYGDQLTTAEANAYRTLWPNEPISRMSNGYYSGVMHHDPVILMSDDFGETWRIATTQDFIDGIVVPEPSSLTLFSTLGLLIVARWTIVKRQLLDERPPVAGFARIQPLRT